MTVSANWICVGSVIALMVMAGCGSKDQKAAQTPAGEQQPPAPATGQSSTLPADGQKETLAVAPPPKAAPPAVKKATPPKQEEKVLVKKPETPPQVAEKRVTIPVGTTISAALITPLRTDSNQVGDVFTARVAAPVTVEGIDVIPAGSEVRGQLTQVEEPHRTKGRAKMTLLFDGVVDANGRLHAIETQPIALEGEGDKISDEAKVGAGAVIGGVIGALTSKKKGKGAAVGAAVGAAAGGAVALATKGKQLVLSPGQQLSIEIAKGAELPVPRE